MEKNRRGWLRPVLAIAVLGALTAAVVVSPVSAHFVPKHERKHVKKIARRIARREARTIVQTTVGPTLFVEETELARFGPISLSATSADVTIGTFGPFTLKAHCDEDPATTLEGQILISTNAAHSGLESDDAGSLDDFSPADGDQVWAGETDTFPDDGSQELSDNEDGISHAYSPTGTTALSGVGGQILLNGEAAGAPDCLISGAVLVNP